MFFVLKLPFRAPVFNTNLCSNKLDVQLSSKALTQSSYPYSLEPEPLVAQREPTLLTNQKDMAPE